MEFEIYCDESRPELFFGPQTSSFRFVLIGSLWLPREARLQIRHQIKEVRTRHSAWGELKWTKVSPSSVELYKDLVDVFFANESLTFRAIAIDSHKINLKLHNNDPELGYYKFYYQLLIHKLLANRRYSIYLDHRKNRLRTRHKSLQTILGRAKPKVDIKIVQAIPSKESDLLQLCDVLLGAAQSRLNASNQGSIAKASVVAHIEQNLSRELKPTGPGEEKFNIFQIWLGL